MAQKRKLPPWSREELEALVAETTDAALGAEYGTSAEAVAKVRRSFTPPIENPRRRGNYRHMIPWSTALAHLWSYDARMLRLDARQQTGGELTPVDIQQLNKWRRELDAAHKVVAYSRERGHFYVRRKPGDEGYVRRP